MNAAGQLAIKGAQFPVEDGAHPTIKNNELQDLQLVNPA